jgi:trehalose 6-phosphate phosphatase
LQRGLIQGSDVDNGARTGALTPLFDAGVQQLEAFMKGRPLLGFDYDGTLAPIVSDPRKARMRETTRALLADLIQRFPCAVISGRAREDVMRLLDGCRPFAVIGNHGIEAEDDDTPPPSHDLVNSWLDELDERLEMVPGIVIEDKTYSLTVHYRASPDPRSAKALALRAARSLESVRVISGIRSLNLLPRDAPHKGTALLRVADKARCGTALFVGDDRTDEDAFGAAADRVFGIRVGQPERSAARYYLRDQAEIDHLLRCLLRLRARRDH